MVFYRASPRGRSRDPEPLRAAARVTPDKYCPSVLFHPASCSAWRTVRYGVIELLVVSAWDEGAMGCVGP